MPLIMLNSSCVVNVAEWLGEIIDSVEVKVGSDRVREFKNSQGGP